MGYNQPMAPPATASLPACIPVDLRDEFSRGRAAALDLAREERERRAQLSEADARAESESLQEDYERILIALVGPQQALGEIEHSRAATALRRARGSWRVRPTHPHGVSSPAARSSRGRGRTTHRPVSRTSRSSSGSDDPGGGEPGPGLARVGAPLLRLVLQKGGRRG